MLKRNGVDKSSELYRDESYFEATLRDKNVRSVYHFIVAGLLCVVIQNALDDYLYDGGSQYGFKRFMEYMESFPSLLIWISAMYTPHFLVYFYWNLRIRIKGKNWFLNLGWNHAFTVCVSLQFFGLWNLFGYLCTKYKISLLCRVFILILYLVLAMKGYSFLRMNMIQLYEYGEKYKLPTFSHYLYFTIAPTLIYKSKYLRSTRGRSWWRLIIYSFEIFANIYLCILIDSMYISKHLHNFGNERFEIGDVIYICWSLSLSSFISSLLVHNLLINSTLKLLAELSCFGERHFFSDWWTTTNMSDFYVKSNHYIQSFIYLHVYKDFYVYVVRGNKLIAKLLAFAISIILHELLVLYGFELIMLPFIGSMLHSLTQTVYPKTGYVYNFLILFQQYFGMGVIFGLFHMEHFAKLNCLNRPETLIYFPRLLSCEINN